MDNEKTVNEIKSTVRAFTEWLDTNSDEYLMLVYKGNSYILAANGDTDRIVMGLVLGSMQDKRLTYIIQRAAKMIELKHNGHANWQEKMIPLSNSDCSSLCRYLRDAASFYLLHAGNTREVDRARLLSIMHEKIATKIIRTQCEQIKEQIKTLTT